MPEFKRPHALADVTTHYCPGCTHGIVPVSYTPLDVYKRQVYLPIIDGLDDGEHTVTIYKRTAGSHHYFNFCGLMIDENAEVRAEMCIRDRLELRPDYERQYFDDDSIYIVSGHTPTKLISGKWEIYHSHNKIVIDCGAAFGGRRACLRLEDMAEFYV